jgi:hypothetical protein
MGKRILIASGTAPYDHLPGQPQRLKIKEVVLAVIKPSTKKPAILKPWRISVAVKKYKTQVGLVLIHLISLRKVDLVLNFFAF